METLTQLLTVAIWQWGQSQFQRGPGLEEQGSGLRSGLRCLGRAVCGGGKGELAQNWLRALNSLLS